MFEHYISQGAKRLRCGYTTGSCATLAAKASCEMLFSQAIVNEIAIRTPKGIPVLVHVLNCKLTSQKASCCVKKDAGDDWDVTDGANVYATVSFAKGNEIFLDGGIGVGRVTRKGLDQPVGNAAINSTPRRMILEEVSAVCKKYGYTGGLNVIISVPNGAELAQKTFNPNLGIKGGISILGTSGIVEPQSLQALVASIEIEIKMLGAEGKKKIIITPGNYGEQFIEEKQQLKSMPRVKCSNFIGDTLDFIASNQIEEVLLVGHIGKLVKLAGGIMNTHSRFADCRTELFALNAALCGADSKLVQSIYNCATTDACIELLLKENRLEAVMKEITKEIQHHLTYRAAGAFRVGAVIFSNQYGVLGITDEAQKLIDKWGKER